MPIIDPVSRCLLSDLAGGVVVGELVWILEVEEAEEVLVEEMVIALLRSVLNLVELIDSTPVPLPEDELVSSGVVDDGGFFVSGSEDCVTVNIEIVEDDGDVDDGAGRVELTITVVDEGGVVTCVVEEIEVLTTGGGAVVTTAGGGDVAAIVGGGVAAIVV